MLLSTTWVVPTGPHNYDHLTTYIHCIRIFIKTDWAYCTCHSEPLWPLFFEHAKYV